MKLITRITLLGSALTLVGCGEAHLNGPVAGADIMVDLLKEQGAQYQYTTTSDEDSTRQEVGSDKWDRWGSSDKFAWIGNFDIDSAFVDNARLYLIQAGNGSDVDFNADGEYDDLPTEILGRWHAIVEGADLRSGDANVNLLTESAYQFMSQDLENLNEEQVRAWLSALSEKLVTDINGDGVVNYDDILAWRGDADREDFLGDGQSLEELANAIANNSSEEDIHAAAMQLWAGLGIDPEQFQGRFAELEGEFTNREGDGNWAAGGGAFRELIESLFSGGFGSIGGGGSGDSGSAESDADAPWWSSLFGSRTDAGEDQDDASQGG